jgi:hypothetical protein
MTEEERSIPGLEAVLNTAKIYLKEAGGTAEPLRNG